MDSSGSPRAPARRVGRTLTAARRRLGQLALVVDVGPARFVEVFHNIISYDLEVLARTRRVRWKELAEAGQNVRKSLKNGGRACKPDSVRRAGGNASTLRRSFL